MAYYTIYGICLISALKRTGDRIICYSLHKDNSKRSLLYANTDTHIYI